MDTLQKLVGTKNLLVPLAWICLSAVSAIYIFNIGLAFDVPTLVVLLCCVGSVSSYYTACKTGPGYHTMQPWIPGGVSAATLEQAKQSEKQNRQSYLDEARYCTRCQQFKPPRAHHCSTCRKCVLRYDHHCDWIDNCVGLHTYKPFLLFLFYSGLGNAIAVIRHLLLLSSCEIGGFYMLWVSAVVIQGVILEVALIAFLYQHVMLISDNTTSVEAWEYTWMHADLPTSPDQAIPWPYDKGVINNFSEVLGDSPLIWLAPWIMPKRDGYSYAPLGRLVILQVPTNLK